MDLLIVGARRPERPRAAGGPPARAADRCGVGRRAARRRFRPGGRRPLRRRCSASARYSTSSGRSAARARSPRTSRSRSAPATSSSRSRASRVRIDSSPISRRPAWPPRAKLVFRDHHRYSDADIASIARAARDAGPRLILTTEKDAVRLAARSLGGLRDRRGSSDRQRSRRPRSPTGFCPGSRVVAAPSTRHRSTRHPTAVRHRLEYLRRPSGHRPGAGDAGPAGRSRRRVAGPRRVSVRSAAPPRRRAERRGGVSRPLGAPSSSTIVRGAFAHFGRLLFELLKFSTLSPEEMLARVEFEGEEHVRAGLRAGQGRAVRDRPLRLLGAAGDGARAAAAADGGGRARARQPPLERAARAHPHAHRQQRDLSAGNASGASCARCRRARASAS